MFRGSIVALVTPMKADGAVDWEALERLIEWHVEEGTHGLVPMGTTGESATLNTPEHLDVIRQTIAFAAGRIPVIAGTGSNSTAESMHQTAEAARLGADACLLVTPYYNRPTQKGLYEHFRAVAEAVAIPQILYNVPGRTAVDMSNETVERLAPLSNIVGIKDATGDTARGRDLVARCGDRIAIYSGDDPTAMELMLAGGHGNISVTANVAPALMAELCEKALAGDRPGAEALNERLAPLNRALFLEANPIPVKWALQQRGKIEAGIRLPLTPLDPRFHEEVLQAMEAAGI
jgi:4-hydroxy-tetrahydrodipicolinate synthase